MAVTKVVINDYVCGLLGESGTTVPDATIIAGMEDFVHRLEQYNPDALTELEVSTTISSLPVTLRFLQGNLSVFCGTEKLARQENLQFIANRYSLLNDLGNTAYFYLIGQKLYIYPYSSAKTYTYNGIAYEVTSGITTFPDKFIYPLAQYCAFSILFSRLSKEAEAISLTGTSAVVDYNTATDGALATARLAADDVELAHAQIDKMRMYIEEYSARVAKDGVISDKLKTRVENVKVMLERASMIYQQYMSYFMTGGAKQ